MSLCFSCYVYTSILLFMILMLVFFLLWVLMIYYQLFFPILIAWMVWRCIFHMGMDQYLYIPFLGDEHPFTSYFDVHQGDRILTHPHMFAHVVSLHFLPIRPSKDCHQAADPQEDERWGHDLHHLMRSYKYVLYTHIYICIYIYHIIINSDYQQEWQVEDDFSDEQEWSWSL